MPYFITSDSCRIYYEEHGSGKPLIFIHGWACNHRFFKYQTGELYDNYRVILYDLRGHGRSDRSEITERNMTLRRLAADLRELIEYLKLDKVNAVGWSMGTSILLSYIRKYKTAHLDKLCFIDMTPKLLNDSEWKLGHGASMTLKKNFMFLSAMSADWDAAAERFTPNCFASDFSRNEPEYEWVLSEVKDNTPHCMVNSWISMASEDYRRVLPRIEIPVLLAYSGKGLICFPEHGEYMKDHIGDNSRLIIFPECGHCLFLEAPEKFNRELDMFLRS